MTRYPLVVGQSWATCRRICVREQADPNTVNSSVGKGRRYLTEREVEQLMTQDLLQHRALSVASSAIMR